MPDGGHVGRNPGAILELLIDLLPLRQAFSARGTQPRASSFRPIDRMMPMLRFFRMGDGSFARFNGLGKTPADLWRPCSPMTTSAAHRSPTPRTAAISASRRPAPSFSWIPAARRRSGYSVEAHAGCLAFEMSVGRQRIIGNCGAPGPEAGAMRRMARTTAAHSTVTLNDTSSCRFLTRTWIGDQLGEAIASGPTRVEVDRHAEGDSTVILARHNGYADRYGIVHERRISLSDAGDRLEGVNSFFTPSGNPVSRSGKDAFAIRFHLDPAVRAAVSEDGKAVIMELPDGERWEFETSSLEVELEESIVFTDARGSRATDQIVIHGRVQHTQSVSWHLHRTALGGRRQRLTAIAANA